MRIFKMASRMFGSLFERLPSAAVFFLVGALGSLLKGQGTTQQLAQSSGGGTIWDLVPGSHSVWFFVFVFWYFFSAITSGMPEPTQDSSPWYIWAYRTFHILAANGTSFFENKRYWRDRNDKEEDTQMERERR
jgi:hypothetical protein